MISCSPFAHYHNVIGLYSIPHCLPSCYRVKIYIVAPRPAVVPFLSMWAVSTLSHPFSVCSEHDSDANLIPLLAMPKPMGFSKVSSLEWGQFCSDKRQAHYKRCFSIYRTTCGYRPTLLNGFSWQKIGFPGLNYPVLSDFFFPFASQMDGGEGPLDSEKDT